MSKITSFLWFDTPAEEAQNFDVLIFKNSRAGHISRSPVAPPGSGGGVMSVRFEIEGQHFTAVNGGPTYKFTAAICLLVDSQSQEERDELTQARPLRLAYG